MGSNKSVSNGQRDAAASSKSVDTDQMDLGEQQLQMEILAQLQKVSQWLYRMEDQVAVSSQQTAQAAAGSTSDYGKLSTDSVQVNLAKEVLI